MPTIRSCFMFTAARRWRRPLRPMPRLPLGVPALLVLLILCGCQGPGSAADARYQAQAAERDPAEARRLNARAVAHLRSEELDAAEELLGQAIAADPMFGPARNNLGKLHFARGDLYEAAWEFEYAIKLMPHQPEPRNNLALVLERARRLDEAIEHYEAALELEPDNPEILGNLLRSRLRRGDGGEEVQQQLDELILKDTREPWVEWARRKRAMMGEP